MTYRINIKILQTDRKNKNILTLSRGTVKTIEVIGSSNMYFKKESVETVLASASFTFQALCKGLKNFYEDIDEDCIEGTNGVWQVT